MAIEFKKVLDNRVYIYLSKYKIGIIRYSNIAKQFMIELSTSELTHEELNAIHQKVNELDEERK